MHVQGCRSGTGYRLTDCAVHCTDQIRFGVRRCSIPYGCSAAVSVYVLQTLVQGPSLLQSLLHVQVGNLGIFGMNYFFKTHVCGPTCIALGLSPELSKDADELQSEPDLDRLADWLEDWHPMEDVQP